MDPRRPRNSLVTIGFLRDTGMYPLRKLLTRNLSCSLMLKCQRQLFAFEHVVVSFSMPAVHLICKACAGPGDI